MLLTQLILCACVISFGGHVRVIFFRVSLIDRDSLSATTEGPFCSVNGAQPTAGLGTGSRGTKRDRERERNREVGVQRKKKRKMYLALKKRKRKERHDVFTV